MAKGKNRDLIWLGVDPDGRLPNRAARRAKKAALGTGVNAKALSTYMGDANISITLDRYGHLRPGNEAEAATLLDAYLDHAKSVEAS